MRAIGRELPNLKFPGPDSDAESGALELIAGGRDFRADSSESVLHHESSESVTVSPGDRDWTRDVSSLGCRAGILSALDALAPVAPVAPGPRRAAVGDSACQ